MSVADDQLMTSLTRVDTRARYAICEIIRVYVTEPCNLFMTLANHQCSFLSVLQMPELRQWTFVCSDFVQ